MRAPGESNSDQPSSHLVSERLPVNFALAGNEVRVKTKQPKFGATFLRWLVVSVVLWT
jgi:hypothetical protein